MMVTNMNSDIKNTDRDSNAELLRLLCMLFIVMHHFAVHSMYKGVLSFAQPLRWDEFVVSFFHGFIYVGVNIFVLISGFYGIKATLRSFIRLYTTCSFFSFILTLKSILCGSESLYSVPHKIVEVLSSLIMPFSHMALWFLVCYLGLFLLSPILNNAVRNFDKKQFLIMILSLTFVNVYLGNYRGFNVINDTGYTLMNFIYIYMVGAYVKTTVNLRKYRYLSLFLYVICSVLWGCMWYVKTMNYDIMVFGGLYRDLFSYNNIFIILSSLGFFIFIMSFSFRSKIVNKFSVSCLAIYIIQESKLLVDYSWYDRYVPEIGAAEKIFIWISFSALFMLVCLLIDLN